jgi:thymidylate kinase
VGNQQRELLRSQNNTVLHRTIQRTANRKQLQSIKYIAKEENLKIFMASVTQELAEQMCGSSWEEEIIALDKYISSRIATIVDMEDSQ